MEYNDYVKLTKCNKILKNISVKIAGDTMDLQSLNIGNNIEVRKRIKNPIKTTLKVIKQLEEHLNLLIREEDIIEECE